MAQAQAPLSEERRTHNYSTTHNALTDMWDLNQMLTNIESKIIYPRVTQN